MYHSPALHNPDPEASHWRPVPQVFSLLMPETGDIILSVGHDFATACETARACLDLDADVLLELFCEGDAVEALQSEYGGAAVLWSEAL